MPDDSAFKTSGAAPRGCHCGCASFPSAASTPKSPGSAHAETAESRAPSCAPAVPASLPYRCGMIPGSASATGQSATPSGPIRFFITASECRVAGGSGRPGDRPDMQLELARRAGLDRPVARVVRPRRDLVHQHLAVAVHEHLHRQQPIRSSASATRRAMAWAAWSISCEIRAGASVTSRMWSRWRFSTVSNDDIAAVGAARHHDADLLREIDEALQHQRLGVAAAPRPDRDRPGRAASPGPCRHSQDAWSSGQMAKSEARDRLMQFLRATSPAPTAPCLHPHR